MDMKSKGAYARCERRREGSCCPQRAMLREGGKEGGREGRREGGKEGGRGSSRLAHSAIAKRWLLPAAGGERERERESSWFTPHAIAKRWKGSTPYLHFGIRGASRGALVCGGTNDRNDEKLGEHAGPWSLGGAHWDTRHSANSNQSRFGLTDRMKLIRIRSVPAVVVDPECHLGPGRGHVKPVVTPGVVVATART